MLNSLKYLKPAHFIKNVEEDMTILHHAASNGDLECIESLQQLPYFNDIINNNTNSYEWAPLLWAASK